MLCVIKNPFMLSVIILNVVMLNGIMLNGNMLSVIMPSVVSPQSSLLRTLANYRFKKFCNTGCRSFSFRAIRPRWFSTEPHRRRRRYFERRRIVKRRLKRRTEIPTDCLWVRRESSRKLLLPFWISCRKRFIQNLFSPSATQLLLQTTFLLMALCLNYKGFRMLCVSNVFCCDFRRHKRRLGPSRGITICHWNERHLGEKL